MSKYDFDAQVYREALNAYLEEKKIGLREFSEEMSLGYQHIWNMLKGVDSVKEITIGRFGFRYGLDEAHALQAIYESMMKEKQNENAESV